MVTVPGGAHPSYAHGYYSLDNAFYVAWDAISRDRERFQAWMQEHVIEGRPERYRELAYAAARPRHP